MFFTNFIPPAAAGFYPNLAAEGVLRSALDPELRMACLDPADIGRFAARALVEHERWRGEVVPLASAHLSLPEIAERLTSAVGGRKEVKVVPVSDEEIAGKRSVLMESELFRNEFRVTVDVEEVRSYGVRLGSWEEFAQREKGSIEVALGLA